MSQIQKSLMHKLYGHDIWEGYAPVHMEETVQGWNGTHHSLATAVKTPGTKVVIDVGVWKGGSSINMAKTMKDNGIDGVVISVDTFLGSKEHWNGSLSLFSRNHGQPTLYWTFLSNIVRAGLTDYVIPMPQTSTTAALIFKRFGIRANVVHVDASHEYSDVMRDAEDYWEILESGGHLIGDDYGLTWSGVIRAAGEFSAKVCRPLSIQPPKWILQKA